MKIKIFIAIGLTTLASGNALAQSQQETVQGLEEFFAGKATSLQDHLSIPVSDQAYYKRFREAYEPLEQGLLPAKWRDKLLERILALVGTNASSLSSAQQAALANSLNTLGTSSASSEEAAAALQSLQDTLGISSDEAANALAQAASDASMFDGNSAVGATLKSNAQAGYNNLQASNAVSNSLNVPQVNTPAQVNYAEGGPVTTVASDTQPSAGSLEMGRFASVLGSGGESSSGTSGSGPSTPASKVVGSTAPNSGSKGDVMQELVKTLGKKGQTLANGNGKTRATGSSSSPLYHQNYYLQSTAQRTPFPQASAQTPSTAPTGLLNENQRAAIAFDPLATLGGDFAKASNERFQEFISKSSGNTSQSGSLVAQAELSTFTENMAKDCSEALERQITASPNKIRNGDGQYNYQEMEKWLQDWKDGIQVDLRKDLNASEDWVERIRKRLAEKGIDPKTQSREKREIIREELNNEFSIRTAHINALARTPDDDCVLSRYSIGLTYDQCILTKSKEECNKRYRGCNDFSNIKSSEEDKIPASDHMEIMTLVGIVKSYTIPEKGEDQRNYLKDFVEGLAQDAPSSKLSSDSNLLSIILQGAVRARNKGRNQEGENPLLSSLFSCFEPNTSWSSKLRDMEFQLRQFVLDKCSYGDEETKESNFLEMEDSFAMPLNILGPKGKRLFIVKSDSRSIFEMALPITSDRCGEVSTSGLLVEKDKISPQEAEKFPDYFGIKLLPPMIPFEKCKELKNQLAGLQLMASQAYEECIAKQTSKTEGNKTPIHNKAK